jgi:threonine/homoserine/homoserine lactone efflux protein
MLIFIGIAIGIMTGALSWQINLVAVYRGLKNSSLAALATGVGATLADGLLIFLVATGLTCFDPSPKTMVFMKALGAILIGLISVKMFFQNPEKLNPEILGKKHLKRSLLAGFVLVVANPGIFVLWAAAIAFLTGYFPEFEFLSAKLLLLAGFILGSFGWYGWLALFLLKKISIRKLENKTLVSIFRITAFSLFLVSMFFLVRT